jgi:hypothetical protein
MAFADSSDVIFSWAGSPLTAVEDCNGIQIELASGESLPYGADLRKKRVTGIRIADDVTFKVPFDDAGGSDFTILNAAHKAKTEAAFKGAIGATVYRQLNMTCTKCNPIPAGGETVMAEITLVNTGTALTEV